MLTLSGVERNFKLSLPTVDFLTPGCEIPGDLGLERKEGGVWGSGSPNKFPQQNGDFN